jgi:hypothetical protein
MHTEELDAVVAARLRHLEEATYAIKQARGALSELEKALRVQGVLKQSRESLKDLLTALRADMKTLQLAGGGASSDTVMEQRLRSVVPVNQPLMLCSQVQRSGGTLLMRLLDGHPACFAHPSELRWGRLQKKMWPRLDLTTDVVPDELFGQLDEGWPKRFAKEGYHKFSKFTEQHHPEQVRYYPFVFDSRLQRTIFAGQLAARDAVSQRDVLNAYLTSLFNAWLDYQNLYGTPKRWVTAFLPRLIMDGEGSLDAFFRDYPDGLLVTLVREPSAWLASFSRHVGGTNARELIDVWLASIEATLRAHAAYPDRVVVVLFEDLVHRTEPTMRRLCERMGIAFSEVLLEPTYNSMRVLSDSSHELATGIDPRVTDRHRDTLSPDDAKTVAEKAAPLFEDVRARFGRA